MKSIKTTFLLAVFVLMASFCFAQNQSKPVIPPKEETTKPQPGQRPKPPPTKKSSVLDKYENYSFYRDINFSSAKLKTTGKYGVIDKQGNEIIPCIYDYISDFNATTCETFPNLLKVEKDGKYGFIDKSNNVVIPIINDEVRVGYYKNACVVKRNGKYGCYDLNGTEVIPCKYDDVSASSNFIYVRMNDKCGVFNLLGKMIILIEYDIIEEPKGGLFMVKLYGEKKYVSITGKEYDAADINYSSFSIVKKNNKYGYVNDEGIEVIPLIYDDAKVFVNKLAFVKKDGKYLIIDETGKVRRTTSYIEVNYDCLNYLFCVKNDMSKWGYINFEGQEIISCRYDFADSFYYELACVQLNSKFGFIDKYGNMAIPCKYDYAGNFRDGYAKVTLNGEEIIIDKKGNRVK